MNTQLPGNLEEIFPLQLSLREELRFSPGEEEVLVDRPSSGQRYSLKPWQYVMLTRFDGEKSFEVISREIYNEFSGAISATGLLNFYEWLDRESLIQSEVPSIFEIDDDTEEAEDFSDRVVDFVDRAKSSPYNARLGMIAVAVIFCVAVFRIAYVAAPIMEPPVERLYAEVGEIMNSESTLEMSRESTAPVIETLVEEIEPAAKIDEPMLEPILEPLTIEAIPEPPAAIDEIKPDTLGQTNRIDKLRREMAECRIRRDEFYLQNDEEGYRREVQKMSSLAREIGEIASSL